jgi:hypothetical protein
MRVRQPQAGQEGRGVSCATMLARENTTCCSGWPAIAAVAAQRNTGAVRTHRRGVLGGRCVLGTSHWPVEGGSLARSWGAPSALSGLPPSAAFKCLLGANISNVEPATANACQRGRGAGTVSGNTSVQLLLRSSAALTSSSVLLLARHNSGAALLGGARVLVAGTCLDAVQGSVLGMHGFQLRSRENFPDTGRPF